MVLARIAFKFIGIIFVAVITVSSLLCFDQQGLGIIAVEATYLARTTRRSTHRSRTHGRRNGLEIDDPRPSRSMFVGVTRSSPSLSTRTTRGKSADDKKDSSPNDGEEEGVGVYVDKPVLRGQFHKWGAIVYPPLLGLPLYLRAVKMAAAQARVHSATTTTTARSLSPDLVRATMLFSFAVQSIMVISATLHTYPWKTKRWHRVARKLDFTAIFVGIASFYSSMGKLLMGHHPLFSRTIEPLVWTCALVGTILKWFVPDAPPWANAVVFLVQGWASLPLIPTMFRSATLHEALGMFSGGVFVTLGALAYSLQWPHNIHGKQQRDIVFGPHEMFHVGTLFMIVSFWYTMWMSVSSSSSSSSSSFS